MGLLTLVDFRDELDITFGERGIEEPTLNRWIHFAYLDLCSSVDFEILDEEDSFSTVSGTRAYNDPADEYMLIKHIRDTTSDFGLSWIPKEDFFRLTAADTGQPKRWTLHKDKIYFYPKPDAAYALKVIYKKVPDVLDEADVTVLPPQWDQAISMFAVHYGYMAMGEENRGIAWYNRAVSYIQTRMTEGDMMKGPGLLSSFNMGDQYGVPNS